MSEVTSVCARSLGSCPSECSGASNTSWSARAGPAASPAPLSPSASDSPGPGGRTRLSLEKQDFRWQNRSTHSKRDHCGAASNDCRINRFIYRESEISEKCPAQFPRWCLEDTQLNMTQNWDKKKNVFYLPSSFTWQNYWWLYFCQSTTWLVGWQLRPLDTDFKRHKEAGAQVRPRILTPIVRESCSAVLVRL